MLGVVCGVIAVLFMLGAGEGAKQKILSRIERLGTKNIYVQAAVLDDEQAAGAAAQRSHGLRLEDVMRIRDACPNATRVSGLLEVPASIIGAPSTLSPQLVATSENYGEILGLRVRAGRFFSRFDVDQSNLVCVLGDAVAGRLGAKGKLGQLVRIKNHLFRVIGILAKVDYAADQEAAIAIRNFNTMVFIPMGTERFVEMVGSGSTGLVFPATTENKHNSLLSEVIVQTRNTDMVPQAAKLIKRILELLHHGAEDYQIVVPLELLKQSQATQRTLNFMLTAIASVSLIVGGIGIMNIMLATVSERTREIGIRRAVGATRLDIIIQFLAETVILTLFGGTIGIALGAASILFAADIGDWHIVIGPWSIVLPLAMALVVALFFGFYPAYRAAKMNPATAFRHE